MSLVISNVFISGFEQVFASKETSCIKFSNLYKWWKLQIIFFFFEWVVTTIR